MAEDTKSFVMSFDPKTIQHLGIRMYSTLPPVIAELIANSYDADAETVLITLLDSDGKKEIIVEDNGIGMTFTELNEKFLRIGRNRRDEEGIQKTSKGRKIIGKKGIGKLSFFGVAQEVEINTKKNGKQNSFVMNWEEIKNSVSPEYNPKPILKEEKYSGEEHGTKIVLRNIKRETEFTPETLADGISKNFIVDSGFKIIIKHNSEEQIVIDNERKYNTIEKEVEWDIPCEEITSDLEYENKDKVVGHLIASVLPIPPKTNMKGIALFSRKKLVNAPEHFSDSTSSHIFSYLTGWLEVDFIDDLDEDVISTNRQSLNWNNPEMAKLREYLSRLISKIERDWRIKREKVREDRLSESTGINISDWVSKLPKEVKDNIEPLIKNVLKNFEPTEETKDVNNKIIKAVHSIAPEYPYYHWRNLHQEVQAISKSYYIAQDYYTALFESAKKYVNLVKSKSSSPHIEKELLENVFSITKPKLSVTDRFKKIDGTNFTRKTLSDINEGHRMLALALWTAFRCPIAHEEVCDLRDSGLFTEKDCLDALSILSHLFRRLDNAELKEDSSNNNSSNQPDFTNPSE